MLLQIQDDYAINPEFIIAMSTEPIKVDLGKGIEENAYTIRIHGANSHLISEEVYNVIKKQLLYKIKNGRIRKIIESDISAQERAEQIWVKMK